MSEALRDSTQRDRRALEKAVELLEESKRNFEASDPPKGCYTRDLIGRIKRFTRYQRRKILNDNN